MKSGLITLAIMAMLAASYPAAAQEICVCKGAACDTKKCPMSGLNPQPKPKP